MRLDSYRTFYKAARRIRLLYEVTIHSYSVMYENGHKSLKIPGRRDEKVEIQLEHRTVRRPLSILTFHAKDVYPQMLRSTMLVRLVAAFEAYLVDTVEEIALRSDAPFETDKRLELSQRQLLAMARDKSVKSHIVDKTARALTGGGLEEIRKFYQQMLALDISTPSVSYAEIEEIHQRRHLYIHRSGYADRQYVHQYPTAGVKIDELIPVPESYLLGALEALSGTALYIKREVEKKFPEPAAWKYLNGLSSISASSPQLVVVEATVKKSQAALPLLDLTAPLNSNVAISAVVVWVAVKGHQVRWLVGGSPKQVTEFFLVLSGYEASGALDNVDSFKVRRTDVAVAAASNSAPPRAEH
jgi:hypothetical protein